jgi:hypothetical protein
MKSGINGASGAPPSEDLTGQAENRGEKVILESASIGIKPYI